VARFSHDHDVRAVAVLKMSGPLATRIFACFSREGFLSKDL